MTLLLYINCWEFGFHVSWKILVQILDPIYFLNIIQHDPTSLYQLLRIRFSCIMRILVKILDAIYFLIIIQHDLTSLYQLLRIRFSCIMKKFSPNFGPYLFYMHHVSWLLFSIWTIENWDFMYHEIMISILVTEKVNFLQILVKNIILNLKLDFKSHIASFLTQFAH